MLVMISAVVSQGARWLAARLAEEAGQEAVQYVIILGVVTATGLVALNWLTRAIAG